MPISQARRIAKIDTPAGQDVLVLNRVVISEQLSQPFRIEADLLSEEKTIKFEDLIGESVTITMATDEDIPRYFNGIVSRFTQMGMESRYEAYRMEIVPRLWAFSRTFQCRIFQNLSVQDIIKKVLEGVVIDWSLTASYQPRDYCVQYRETDLNFISRLMEEEGIHYFFKHSQGQHTMVIADNPGAHEVLLDKYTKIAYRPYTGRPTGAEFIYDWAQDKLLLPAIYTHTDYDFESPKKNLLSRSEKVFGHALDTGEWYDFPGLHTSTGVGDKRARVRCEEIHTRYEIAKGKADARGIQAGFVFTLMDHPRDDQNAKHLVTAAVHTIQLDALESGDIDRGAPYLCSFSTIPASVPYRPQRITPKPFVQGPQTAMVVGPAGEEIYTDKYGRVKVQFHWDREGKFDQNSSCWVRVSQIWAGKNWGGMTIPRIGQEVVVDFLEGDPDQPIIIGRVYNGESMPPYGLPDKKVVSGVKTNSTLGGDGYNELSMDDTKGSEKYTTHAQKDMDTTVLNDETHDVGHDRTTKIGNNDTETVGMNQSITIGNDQTLTIAEKQTTTIGMSQTVDIGAELSTTGGAEASREVGAARPTDIGAEDTLDVGAALNMTAGAEIGVTAGAEISITAGGAIEITAGGAIVITGGAAITIEAGAAVAISSAVAIAIDAPALALNGRPVLPLGPEVPI